MAKASSSQLVRLFLITAFFGGGFGIFAKLSDESIIANNLGINDLGTYFGLWIVLATVFTVQSSSRRVAVFRVTLFFLAMLTAYYIVTDLLFNSFPLSYFLGWLVVMLMFAPLYAILVWYTKEMGWKAALGAAVPVGLLLWEAYSLRFRLQFHQPQFVFDIVAAVTLFLVVPKESMQRMQMIILTPIVMVVIEIANQIVPFVLGAL